MPNIIETRRPAADTASSPTITDSVAQEPSNDPAVKHSQPAAAQVTGKSSAILRKTLLSIIAICGIGAASYYGSQWLSFAGAHEETDDAYISGHLHQVSSRIPGTVQRVLIDDNEHVKAGQLLALLDPRDYQAQLDQARANLLQAERSAEAAKTTVEYQDTTAAGQTTNAHGAIDNATSSISKALAAQKEAESNIQTSQAQLSARDAELERAKLDYDRYESLEKQRAVTTSQRDAARRDYLVAVENRKAAVHSLDESMARLDQARETVGTARAQLVQAQAQLQLAKASGVQTHVNVHQFHTNLASIESARAALEQAELNLSYTKLTAPTAGRIGKKTLEEGQRLEPGQPVLTVVSDEAWVVANFKETQLKKMRPGQKVEIKVDSCPDHTFEGHVLSFSPASGTSFAILPSDNATGNFTKIVQRLPVKIVFTPDSLRGFENRLAPGLSVVATVDLKDAATMPQGTISDATTGIKTEKAN
jgi:membrane fusion protein (multidrug efflux system)